MDRIKRAALLASTWPISCFVMALDLSEGDFLVDLPYVASATRLTQSITDSPASVTVIDRNTILASGFVEIPDLLRLVPGFQVGLTWRDHHTAIAYHGQSDGLTRDMLIMLNGRIAFGAQFGIIDWDRLGITVSELERIEVVRGPSSAAYGSNAFSGTINLVTRDTALSPAWGLSATTGSNDFGLVSLRYSTQSEKLDYQLAASYFETEGFEDINDQTEVNTLSFSGRYLFHEQQSLDAEFSLAKGESGRGGTAPPFDPVNDRPLDEYNALVRWNFSSSKDDQSFLQFSYIRSAEYEQYDIGLLSDLLGVLPSEVPVLVGGLTDGILEAQVYDIQSHRVNLDFQQTYQFGDNFRFVWGAGVQEESVKGAAFFSNSGGWEDVKGQLFLNAEKSFQNFALNAGFLFEDGDLAEGKLSSRIGINYKLSQDHVLRASYATSYRQPFAGEAYLNTALYSQGVVVDTIVATPKVPEPEKVESFELGYVASLLEGRVSAEAKLYREKYSNQVQLQLDTNFPERYSFFFSPGALVRGNCESTTIDGLEFGLRYQSTEAFNLWFSYAYADAEQFSSPQAVRGMLRYNGTPKHTASVLGSYKLGSDWEISMGFYHLGNMSWLDALSAPGGNYVESYNRVDVRVAKYFKLPMGNVLVELIGQNLGEDYGEFSPSNQFSTRTFMRVGLELD